MSSQLRRSLLIMYFGYTLPYMPYFAVSGHFEYAVLLQYKTSPSRKFFAEKFDPLATPGRLDLSLLLSYLKSLLTENIRRESYDILSRPWSFNTL